MDKIICLVGESGAGKSTIAELLEKGGYNYIQSYTTRPQRYENEKGHIFVDYVGCFYPEIIHLETGDCMVNNLRHNVIAYTFFDNNHYWATSEQYQGKGTSVYVVDPRGARELKEKVRDAEIVVIYLKVDSDVRFERMLKRNTDKPKIYIRLEHDKEAFKIVECNYVVDANRPIENILKDIKSLI